MCTRRPKQQKYRSEFDLQGGRAQGGKPCAIAPPTTGPAMRATPVTPLKRPRARPRSSRGKAAAKSAIASGTTRAAPAPWRARAAISKPTLVASPHATDPPAKSPMP
jgi:hypothetical protein